jgi:hypothetical protein
MKITAQDMLRFGVIDLDPEGACRRRASRPCHDRDHRRRHRAGIERPAQSDPDMIRKQRRQKFLDIGRNWLESPILQVNCRPMRQHNRQRPGFFKIQPFWPQLGPDTDI